VRFNSKTNPVPSKTTHNTLLEVVWTLLPVIILVVLVIPSLKMLYYVDKTVDAEMTLKVTGYQWYWGYEYPDNGGINFLSNLVQDSDLKPGQPRLLATDNPVVLPVDTNIKILTAASDVIHAWAIPAFGIKMDAVPGRLNETWVRIDKEGTFYGQCSEICGQGHGYMPIEVHAVSRQAFAEWVKKQGGKMPEIKNKKAGE
jgi:cytochrome c oxidase subunit 2